MRARVRQERVDAGIQLAGEAHWPYLALRRGARLAVRPAGDPGGGPQVTAVLARILDRSRRRRTHLPLRPAACTPPSELGSRATEFVISAHDPWMERPDEHPADQPLLVRAASQRRRRRGCRSWIAEAEASRRCCSASVSRAGLQPTFSFSSWGRLDLDLPVPWSVKQHAGERSDEPAELTGGRTQQALHRARGALELVSATKFA